MKSSAEAMELNEEAKLVSCKKRKLYSELEDEYCAGVESSDEEDVLKNTSSRSSDLEKADLESEGLGTDVSTSINAVFSRETTPTRDLPSEDSKEVLMKLYLSLSTPRKKTLPPANHHRKIPAELSPSATELEEFFAASEKVERKRFAEKYNYDIVKDVPLEGKYEWVRLQP